jgi:hypothetical protein
VDFGGGKLRMYYSSTNNVGRDGTSRWVVIAFLWW